MISVYELRSDRSYRLVPLMTFSFFLFVTYPSILIVTSIPALVFLESQVVFSLLKTLALLGMIWIRNLPIYQFGTDIPPLSIGLMAR
jgi:hypothetical protein